MLYGRWILFSAFGGILIGLMSRPGDFLTHLVLRGLIIGVVQWPVIRAVKLRARHWVWLTGLGMILANLLVVLPVSPTNEWINWLAILLHAEVGLWEVFWLNLLNEGQTWLLVGLGQWIFLNHRAPLWLVASALGGVALGATKAVFCFHYCHSLDGFMGTALTNAAMAACGWAAYGLMTGWALKSKPSDLPLS